MKVPVWNVREEDGLKWRKDTKFVFVQFDFPTLPGCSCTFYHLWSLGFPPVTHPSRPGLPFGLTPHL